MVNLELEKQNKKELNKLKRIKRNFLIEKMIKRKKEKETFELKNCLTKWMEFASFDTKRFIEYQHFLKIQQEEKVLFFSMHGREKKFLGNFAK